MRDRLYRSRDDRVLFGVCGGVADWLDLDPSLVRIAFALLVITGGIGLLLYIIMAIVVPPAPGMPAPGMPAPGMPDAAGGASAPSGTPTDPAAAMPPAGGPAAAAPGFQPGTWMTEREARRASRHAARQQRRASRDGRAGMIFGAILVLIGVWFLVRRYIPSLDSDFLGPIVLIAIGAIVLAGALGRHPEDDAAKPPR
ncbi:MAG: PspC domain-containing protein [Chloroflexi bacterium]|nr:PspC domain-containing protein [Chloroflexota bacterium]